MDTILLLVGQARTAACYRDLHKVEKCQRGLTEEMPENVPFLHSESCHSLHTQPTDTILALNESWYRILHEDVLLSM